MHTENLWVPYSLPGSRASWLPWERVPLSTSHSVPEIGRPRGGRRPAEGSTGVGLAGLGSSTGSGFERARALPRLSSLSSPGRGVPAGGCHGTAVLSSTRTPRAGSSPWKLAPGMTSVCGRTLKASGVWFSRCSHGVVSAWRRPQWGPHISDEIPHLPYSFPLSPSNPLSPSGQPPCQESSQSTLCQEPAGFK